MSVARPLVLNRPRVDVRALGLPTLGGTALAATALLGLLYLAQTSGVASNGYDVQALEAEKAQVQLRNRQIRYQMAEARSLARIERDARSRLEMAAPERVVFVPSRPALVTPADSSAEAGGLLEAIRRDAARALGWLRDAL